jgi:hypothetical protein
MRFGRDEVAFAVVALDEMRLLLDEMRLLLDEMRLPRWRTW